MVGINLKYILLLSVGIILLKGCAPKEEKTFQTDITLTCQQMPQLYYYFKPRKNLWVQACEKALSDIEAVESSQEFLIILERLLDSLYDPHISLNTNGAKSPRLVPSGADMAFDYNGAHYILTAIRPRSGAANAGLKIGDRLVSFNNLNVDKITATRMHISQNNPPIERLDWALSAALAGYRHQERIIEINRDGAIIKLTLDDPVPPSSNTLLHQEKFAGNIGYIKIHNSLDDDMTVEAFDKALTQLKDTKGLILDLRQTPGGGNTDVAEPILGRFISKRMNYQIIAPKNRKNYLRPVFPRGETYEKPMIVLAGRWTGSMGEGMAVGFDAMNRAEVWGDKMAGLAGGIEELHLPASNISIRIPIYGIKHINGTSRHHWQPQNRQTADNGNGPDILFEKALAHIQ